MSESETLAAMKADTELGAVISPDANVGAFYAKQLKQSAQARGQKPLGGFDAAELNRVMREKWGDDHDTRMEAVGAALKAAGKPGETLRDLMAKADPKISVAAFNAIYTGIERRKASA